MILLLFVSLCCVIFMGLFLFQEFINLLIIIFNFQILVISVYHEVKNIKYKISILQED